MCTTIVLCSMYNSSLCSNWGDHSNNHVLGVEQSWADISEQAKNIFTDHQGIHSGSWSLVCWSTCRRPWRTSNFFRIYRTIEEIVNSSQKRVASGATPAKGAAPKEVIRVDWIHTNSSKLLTNSQFHLHRYSKISSAAKSERVPEEHCSRWCDVQGAGQLQEKLQLRWYTAGIYGRHNTYTSTSFNYKQLLTTALISWVNTKCQQIPKAT